MRRLWLTITLCLLVSLLAGCGGQEAPSLAGSFGEPVEISNSEPELEPESTAAARPTTGSFAMAYNAGMSWDPFTSKGMENQAVMQLIYESLFTMNPQFEAEPLLVESYTVSSDGLLYTLELREAQFSSGKTLTASDVVYSIGRAAMSELYGARFRDIAGYGEAGASTVEIRLENANDRLPCLLTFPIVPSGSPDEAPLGTGPFTRNGEVLTRNVNWWQGMDTLGFQTVTLYSSASAEDTRDNFEIDNVHFVYNNPSATTAATFHCDYELWNSRSTVMQYIGFNFTSGIFQDPEVRTAVTHAIDRISIAESVYHNFADPAVLPVPTTSTSYFEDLAQKYNYTSVQEARNELLASESFYLPPELLQPSPSPEADGLPDTADAAETGSLLEAADIAPSPSPSETPEEDGDEDEEKEDDTPVYNQITLVVRSGNLSREAAARAVAENLKAVGFTVTVQSLANNAFYEALSSNEFDLYYGEIYLKPDFDLRDLLFSGYSYCYGGLWYDDTLVSLMYDAMENSGNRYDLYEYIMERGYLCPVMFVNNAVFTTRGVFSELNPAPGNLFYEVAKIKVNN